MSYTSTMNDKRNVLDEFKGWLHEDIIKTLDNRGVELEVAIENLAHDFNMGTIVRNANAFGVRQVHVIGKKQWNKRGAMVTNRYLHVHHHANTEDFMKYVASSGKTLIALENNRPKTQALNQTKFPKNCILLFGSENSGISDDLLEKSKKVVAIEQFGSTRSVNVGVASGIAMYAWLQQHGPRDGRL